MSFDNAYRKTMLSRKVSSKTSSRRRSDVVIASETASYGSLWHQPHPIAAAFTRPTFQVMFIVIGIVTMSAAFSNMQVVDDVSGYTSHRLRFTVLELRDAAQDPSDFNVGSFGVLLDGKEVPAASLVKTGSSLVVSFSEGVKWNMWFFETSGLVPNDPVRFTLESEEWQPATDATDTCVGGPDSQLHWRMVGSSSELTYHVTRTLFHGHFPTSTKRGIREVIDQRFAFGCYLGTAAQFISPGLLTIVSAVAGAFGREQVGQVVIPLTHLIEAIACGLIGAWYFVSPTSRGANLNALFHAVNSASFLVAWNFLRVNQVWAAFLSHTLDGCRFFGGKVRKIDALPCLSATGCPVLWMARRLLADSCCGFRPLLSAVRFCRPLVIDQDWLPCWQCSLGECGCCQNVIILGCLPGKSTNCAIPPALRCLMVGANGRGRGVWSGRAEEWPRSYR